MTEEFTLTLTDMANGGNAIGKVGKKTIFVPYAIPGEEITARIVTDKGRFAFAEGVAIHDVSADRVLPRCPHFGASRCGGCTWQHIDYAAQLALKTDIVADQLSRIGGFDEVPVEMALGSEDLWVYAHEAMVYPLEDGKLGFRSTDGKTPISIDECHIIRPELLALMDQLDFELDSLEQVILRVNEVGELMVILSTSDDEAPALEVDLPASVNFLLSDDEPVNLIGATHLNYQIFGQRLRVTAGSFFRANISQTALMLQVIGDWLDLDGSESILDVFTGVGTIAAYLAPHANLITCVDDYPPAMTDAEENLSEFEHVNVIEGDAAEVLLSVPDDEPYDIVIFDPPSDGLAVDMIDALENVLPARIIYIGDEPSTLARDVKRLHEHYGYVPDVVQPIDFAPQTHRISALVHLSREA